MSKDFKIEEDLSGLNKLISNAEQLNGGNLVPLGEILNEDFLQANTDFETVEDLFQKAGYQIDSQEDLDTVPQEDIDVFISKNTKYATFSELMADASNAYISKMLLKGLE